MLDCPPRGSLVEAQGLKGRTDLNGKRGVLNGRVQEERWGVDFPPPHGTKAVRREQLALLREAGECAPMPQRFLAPMLSGSAVARQLRFLAYGDSLTAGYCHGGKRFWPYGAALAKGLLPDVVAEVWVCGLSSLTAGELVESIDDTNICDGADRRGVGLRKALTSHGPFDLALIMAGTNDLGSRGADPHAILTHIRALHAECHREGIQTVALSVPPSGAMAEIPRYRKRWQCLNSLLGDWARRSRDTGVRLFVDTSSLVPFVEGSELWEDDGLHLSESGSEQLGQRLVPLIKPLLLAGIASAVGCAAPPGVADVKVTG